MGGWVDDVTFFFSFSSFSLGRAMPAFRAAGGWVGG